MDLNQLYFDHQLLLMKARRALSGEVRRAKRFRTASVFTPPRDCPPRQVRITHPAHLPSGCESVVAHLNAELAAPGGRPLDPATEGWPDRTGAGTEAVRSAPGRRPGEA